MNARSRSIVRLVTLATLVIVAAAASSAGCRGNFNSAANSDDFLAAGRTLSFFDPIQVDPPSEDSAGPQFVTSADLNGDGLPDLVSAWNQTQPVQIHLQSRDAAGASRFETITLAGNVPVVAVAGLAVADFDGDGRQDIAVLVKETLLRGAACVGTELPAGSTDLAAGSEGTLDGVILIYFGPAPEQANQALAWADQNIKSSFLVGAGPITGPPELDGFTSMAVDDMDFDGDSDIVVAWNPSPNCGEKPEVLVFTNTDAGSVRSGVWPVEAIADPFNCGILTDNCAPIKDVALDDIDRDGDVDIVVTFPAAGSMNVRWYRNPTLRAVEADGICYRHDGTWNVGTVGQIEPRLGFSRFGDADIVRLADIDRDGITDVVVRSTDGRIIQWLKGPECPTTPTTATLRDFFRNIPWQVFTLAEFTDRTPEAIALGDLNFDGQTDLIVAAEGGLAWFDSTGASSLFDQWTEHLIIDDRHEDGTDADPATTDPSVTPAEVGDTTIINSIWVVDLDTDGSDDFVVTLDRSGLSGLSNDALVWFRNTMSPGP